MMRLVNYFTRTPVLAVVFVAFEDTEPSEDIREQNSRAYVAPRYALSPRNRVADGIPGTIRAMRTDELKSSLHVLQ